jgi:hypothetical protein
MVCQVRINAERGYTVARGLIAFALGRLSSTLPLPDREPLP